MDKKSDVFHVRTSEVNQSLMFSVTSSVKFRRSGFALPNAVFRFSFYLFGSSMIPLIFIPVDRKMLVGLKAFLVVHSVIYSHERK